MGNDLGPWGLPSLGTLSPMGSVWGPNWKGRMLCRQ